MAFELPALPYAKDALEPHITANTLDFHHGKHHNTYVVNLNNLTKDSPMAGQSLEEIIKATAGDASKAGVFNNAAQVWNHTFYWNCMKPGGGGAPTGDLADKINAAFGSYEKFCEEFKNACVTQFGSGWGWLVVNGLCSLAVGVIVLIGWPGTAAWSLGLLMGLNFLTTGISLLMLSGAFRKAV